MSGHLAADREEQLALLTLRLLPGVGDRILHRVLLEVRSRSGAIEVLRRGVQPGLREARLALSSGEARRQAEALWARAQREGIQIVGVDEVGYPPRLRRLVDPPSTLFLRGDLERLERVGVAIVGSRRATAPGRRVAERMARELGSAGVTVLSGMALGIDGAAHRGALGTEGGTVAVLGRGPDVPYPLTHAGLFREVARQGLLLSEFPPGEAARPHNFPRRNRILAALAEGVVVVEAQERSGALITVDHAIDLGVEVMAVPGSVEAPSTRGSNVLLRDGVTLVTSGHEVLSALKLSGPSRAPSPASAGGALGLDRSPDAEGDATVLSLLSPSPTSVESLLEWTGLPPSRTLATLTRLELAGAVRREPEGWVRFPAPL